MLADEGVPVRAIARATRIPGEAVYDILKTAIEEGRLIDLPRDDWPAGPRTERRQSEVQVLSLDNTTLRIACANRFKMTRLQAVVFLTLLRRNEVTKTQLHDAIEHNRPENSDPTDQKMVDVVVCHIRRKLKKFPKDPTVYLKTIWGVGYSIPQEQRSYLLDVLAEHLSGVRAMEPRQ
jgi:DNA-binding response OmpR family regulator